MAVDISIAAIPNQSLSVAIDGHRYEITIKTIPVETTIVTIVRDGITVVSNTRAVAGRMLMKFDYEENGIGNFLIYTQGDELPDYTKFGVTQFLTYIPYAELVVGRAAV